MRSMNSSALAPRNLRKPRSAPIHPVWLRMTHWLNALAVLVLVTSGWRIYNASPVFDFSSRPRSPGWLAGRRTAMALRGDVAAGHQWPGLPASQPAPAAAVRASSSRSRPRHAGATWAPRCEGRLAHADPRHYNSVQRVAYLFVIADIVLLVLSGPGAVEVRPVSAAARAAGRLRRRAAVHFFAMAALVAFVVGASGDGGAGAPHLGGHDPRPLKESRRCASQSDLPSRPHATPMPDATQRRCFGSRIEQPRAAPSCSAR